MNIIGTLGSPPFTIGQKVYVAWANAYSQQQVECPICAGKRSVTLILGSGEHVSVECAGCDWGFEGAHGYVTKYGPASGFDTAIVTGLTFEDGKWSVCTRPRRSDGELFTSELEASRRRVAMYAEAEERALAAFELQFKHKRMKHGLSVNYHRSEIVDLERKLAWHKEKLSHKEGPLK
jgi:hypothetical protein